MTLRVVEQQKWGFGDCEAQIDARGLPSCIEDSRGSTK
jgi:hypothetical protein